MNLDAVRLFLEVAEAGSLTKVANRRQTVQSHVSRQISDFEAGMGTALFRRTGRGVVLTAVGERVASRLRLWLLDTERMTEELRAESGSVKGEVRLGIIPSAVHPLMTRLCQSLKAEHPGIRLSISEAQGAELDNMLDGGLVDLAILFRYHPPRGDDEKPLAIAHTYLIGHPGDELTSSPTVPFSRLESLPLVLPRRPSHWRNALDETARSLGFRLQAVVEADSLTLQKQLVAQTPGTYSLLGPYAIMTELEEGKLSCSKVVRPDLTRHVTLALPKQGKLSPATRIVAQAITERVEAWGGQLFGR
ncbi:DNA-binding transcriptional LysR family regulator [Comamonas sp. BIGb0124]|mgnify:FL=1|uniref:LysR family transcriptional regulator n=1 Tax=Comamonas sp. BIGb0124 TaxID=2485130 RepID=UPI000F475C62|nr:LysR family transcriptional regulator [Comamonas sp. BIGb0124]ROR20165.1 DNA-binding transcriptional LysR family regulator [Comamonas sp. BIGb0124]